VRVQLLFVGGPWADRLLESSVATAPEFVAPDGTHIGVYRRTEEPGFTAVVYEWSPDGTGTSRPDPPSSRVGERADSRRDVRVRFGVEAIGAVVAVVLAIVTLFSRAWIEDVFRFDPDRSSGVWEWAVVFGFAASALGLTLAARQQWRRLKAAE
jgi:hypothetical protein